tara:strand:+ start:7121 stop:7279 length:159 start_codon:yes stop_codon:yes gene_type:complete
MAIEIRELVIRVKVQDSPKSKSDNIDVRKIKQDILKECRREIKKELNRMNER